MMVDCRIFLDTQRRLSWRVMRGQIRSWKTSGKIMDILRALEQSIAVIKSGSDECMDEGLCGRDGQRRGDAFKMKRRLFRWCQWYVGPKGVLVKWMVPRNDRWRSSNRIWSPVSRVNSHICCRLSDHLSVLSESDMNNHRYCYGCPWCQRLHLVRPDETGETICWAGDENRLLWLIEKQHNEVCRRLPNSVGCSISVALCSAYVNQSETQAEGKAVAAESFRHVPQIFRFLVT